MSSYDLEMARKLQAQFDMEDGVKCSRIAQSPSKNCKWNKENGSSSLVDPSWEYIDPTPNIHILFVTFDKKFFWGQLATVSVAWSKRMYSCAGICYYHGRHSGRCNITLSEPLLKLRPRKDLIETLLHEMIHAYLFVTHNNRDRDGHGPEFHKHMYRINKEAGTKISVYHSFHDEVKLYKVHWWRCNGPCQKEHPFFGMVRRSINRAPGPSDRWWADHQHRCGGTFIKVKEPEKPPKKNEDKMTTKGKGKAPTKNIESYFLPSRDKTNQPATLSNLPPLKPNNIHGFHNTSTPIPPLKDTTNKPSTSAKPPNNIHGFINTSSSNNVLVTPNNSLNKGNVVGFKDLSGNRTKNAISNRTNTLVVTKNQTKNSDQTKNVANTATSTPAFSGQGHSLGGTNTDDYSATRNHWLNKFENNTRKDSNKRVHPVSTDNAKRVKTDAGTSVGDDLAACPVCDKKLPADRINQHLDSCLSKGLSLVPCPVCEKRIEEELLEVHLKKCLEENCKDEFDSDEVQVTKEIAKCPVCCKEVEKGELNSHLDDCMNCKDNFESNDDVQVTKETVKCLVCSEEVEKSKLDAHLDDCMNDSVFLSIDDETEEKEFEKTEDSVVVISDDSASYNCPVCLELVPEDNMNEHLNVCLNNPDRENNSDQLIAVEELLNSSHTDFED